MTLGSGFLMLELLDEKEFPIICEIKGESTGTRNGVKDDQSNPDWGDDTLGAYFADSTLAIPSKYSLITSGGKLMLKVIDAASLRECLFILYLSYMSL
ncbi:Hypothetical protein HVR_LOCUS1093 [uncultured virus]|nr:Hypothetical protein HVR_LOCUS1093 [uncultured virus]